jgi:hypothetical protein
MKLHTLFLSVSLTFSLPIFAQEAAPPAAPAAPEAAGPKLDFGDFSSSTLTTKAWEAQGAGNAEAAIAYAGKCIEMYAAEAKKMQAALTAPAPKETAFEHWALNDVGTSLFITGLAKEGSDKKGALAAYKDLVANYSYAQCWDTKGWFWSPADAAKGKLKTLEFEAMSEGE